MKSVVPSEKNKERLDKFLTEITGETRSQLQKKIKEGLILINQKKVAPHHFLKTGEEIEISENTTPTQKIKLAAKTKAVTAAAKKIPAPKIIFEDENFLVINKPAGLLTHPREKKLFNQEPTVVHWLIEKYPAIKEVGNAPELRPGLVHRLDKEASGVMVIAKTNAAYDHLKEQFKNREIIKEYRAIVYGKMPSNCGTIAFPIGHAGEGGRMAARPLADFPEKNQGGKEAKTFYEVLVSKPNYSVIKVFPKTGRTHQIRVHFFALNHPLIGDPIYQSKSYKKIPCERLMLHAHKLTFKDLKRERETFIAPLPDCFCE
ncbi:MAG: RluA family pseudouridine synthase [Candidatus Magasanikbacteria bacterium]|nr:RluA family pseudouridine synthase [Candidatus Magasanikbacteria bacterium]